MEDKAERDRINRFWDWVERTRKERQMSWREMERQAGVGNATIANRSRQRKDPTDATLQAVADAFSLTYREVLEHAGLIETADSLLSDSEFVRVYQMLKRMTPSQIEDVEGYIRVMMPEVVPAKAPENVRRGGTPDNAE